MSEQAGHRPATLITGGSSGIGAAIARRLLTAGHRVAVTGRDPDRLASLAASVGAGNALLTVAGDAADYAAVSQAVQAAAGRFGRLDNVVACAGTSGSDSLADGDAEQWREMTLTNVLGPALLIRAAVPALRSSRGRIVLIGSALGLRNVPGSFYSATKWAVTALAENARMQLASDGITVTLISPGRTDTPWWDRMPAGSGGSGGSGAGAALSAAAVADVVAWVISQPAGTAVSAVVVRPQGLPPQGPGLGPVAATGPDAAAEAGRALSTRVTSLPE